MTRLSQPGTSAVKMIPHPVDQIVRVFEATFWDWDDDRATKAVAEMDGAGERVLGYLFRHWTLSGGEEGCTGPFGVIVDLVHAYVKYPGDDPAIFERLQAALDPELHPEGNRRMAEEEAAPWRERGDYERAEQILREWGYEPTAEELPIGGAS